jgi:hypothetical protein
MATAAQTAPHHTSQQTESTQKTKLASEVPKDPSDITAQTSDRQKIAALAYSYWEARGSSGGSAEEDWIRAEQALYSDPSRLEQKPS